MRIISFIEDPSVIRDTLNHTRLWLVRSRPPPKAYSPPMGTRCSIMSPCVMATSNCKHSDTIYGDPEYTWDEYIHPEGHKQS